MSKGDVVCCIQIQSVQKQMDGMRIDIISGVTSGPCGPYCDCGKGRLITLSIMTLLPVVGPGA